MVCKQKVHPKLDLEIARLKDEAANLEIRSELNSKLGMLKSKSDR